MKINARAKWITAAAGTLINQRFYTYPQKCTMLIHSFTVARLSLRQNNWVTLSRIAQYYALVTAKSPAIPGVAGQTPIPARLCL